MWFLWGVCTLCVYVYTHNTNPTDHSFDNAIYMYTTVQPPAVSDVPDLPTYMPKDPSEMAVLSDQPANQKARKVNQ